jgi:antitoxin YefM
MASPDMQYISDERGEPTAVIVPISLWREIEAERETAYLLKSNSSTCAENRSPHW